MVYGHADGREFKTLQLFVEQFLEIDLIPHACRDMRIELLVAAPPRKAKRHSGPPGTPHPEKNKIVSTGGEAPRSAEQVPVVWGRS